MPVFRKERVPNISDLQWQRLGEYFSIPRAEMAHAIGNAGGLSFVLADALILAMATDGVAELHWAVFHNCVSHPVDYRRFRDGVVRGVWSCPECELEVQADDLRYSIECRSAAPIVFE